MRGELPLHFFRVTKASPCHLWAQTALCPTLNRTGAVWHATVEGLRDPASLCWGWRAEADISWAEGSRFVPGALLLLNLAQRVAADAALLPPSSLCETQLRMGACVQQQRQCSTPCNPSAGPVAQQRLIGLCEAADAQTVEE